MARGISRRHQVTIPAMRARDVTELDARLTDVTRNIERAFNGLPIASTGFHFTRSTNEAATANLAETSVTWNTVVQDRENWMPAAGTVQTITVPRELSGLYLLRFACYWVNSVAMTPFIRVNGNAITVEPPIARAYASIVGVALLNDGDTITAGVLNQSGANQTITTTAGDTYNHAMPSLQAWRIAVL